MSSTNRNNYAAARAYSAGAKISRVCNEYPGVPDRAIRYRETCLSTAWRYVILSTTKQCWRRPTTIYRAKYGVTRSIGFFTIRCVSCYLKRQPDLLLRDSQVIKRARNEHVIKRNSSLDWVFRMNETEFSQKNKKMKVIVVKVSKNVWSKSDQCNFHLMIVA
uniref:Uncharacterized protein n=1 Tax=Hyaloperonospora arabidopsidis (strain Emoy2) TaxID=559515 RepID=M4BU01_HYAAE